MRFSIIIPAYNVEQYIEQCVDSICQQKFPKDNFEVIVVDDASPDGLGSVVQALTSKYENLRYIKHSVNKHQGGARNTGLEICHGDYVMFVDGDDIWLYDNVLELFDILLKTNVDIVLSYVNSTVDDNYVYTESSWSDKQLRYKIYEGHDYLLSSHMRFCVCLGCYRKDFLFDNKIAFAENVFFEDGDWCLKTAYFANRVLCINFPFYGYRQTPISTTRGESSISFQDDILMLIRDEEFISQQQMENDVLSRCRGFIKSSILSCNKFSRNYRIQESLRCLKILRESTLLTLDHYELTFWGKVKMLVLKHCPIIFVAPIRVLTLTKRAFQKKKV